MEVNALGACRFHNPRCLDPENLGSARFSGSSHSPDLWYGRADQSFPGAVPTQLRWVRSLQLNLPLQRTDKKRHKETTSRGILHSVRRLLSGLFQECSGLFFFKAETPNRAQYICRDCGIPARLISGYCAYLKLLIFGIESNPVKGIDHTGGYIAKM